MKKRNAGQLHKNMMDRLAVIAVAVVFVLGTMALPAGVYAAETDPSTDEAGNVVVQETDTNDVVEETTEAETVETEAPEETVVDEAETEPTEPEPADPETSVEELADMVADVEEGDYDGYVYKIKDDTTKVEIKEMEKAIDELDAEQEVEEVVSNEIYAADSLETISEVAEAEQIECIEPNYIFRACATPNDYFYKNYGWYLEMINAPYVWDQDMFGSDTVVAVLDSGVKMDHADFASGLFVDRHNAIENSDDVTDYSGHGTAVTGVVAASYNNGRGLTGIVPNAKIMPVKVMEYNEEDDVTEGELTDVIKGINYAAKHGADVINLSAGSTYNSSLMKAACKEAADKGVIIVAAAGNDANSALEYPASYDTVVSVGSVNKKGNHSKFSNYNKYVAVCAPGEDIVVPYKDGKYTLFDGTSFSTPQVAAMAAMVKSIAKKTGQRVDYEGFMDIIKGTSVDKGSAGFDNYYGYGLMDLSGAYRYMYRDMSAHWTPLSSSSFEYTGSSKTPSVKVKHLGETLTEGTDYTVSYDSRRTEIGTYKVTIKGEGAYTNAKTVSFKIVPPLVKSIKAPKRLKKKLTVRWGAMSKSQKKKNKNLITGYQVRVATNNSFSGAKYVKVKGIAKTKATVKGLKKKTTYYVQYRAYKTVGSQTYYSKWSGTKKAKTK